MSDYASIKDIESIVNAFLRKEVLTPDGLTGEFYQILQSITVLLYNPAISGIYPVELKNYVHTKTGPGVLISVLFSNIKTRGN